MTQGRVEYESMIPRGMDEGLDLWEASELNSNKHSKNQSPLTFLCECNFDLFLSFSNRTLSHSQRMYVIILPCILVTSTDITLNVFSTFTPRLTLLLVCNTASMIFTITFTLFCTKHNKDTILVQISHSV